jgi:hypothetical protein
MPLFHHAQTPAADGGMSLTPMLAAMTAPAPGGGVTLGADVLSCHLHLLPARSFGAIGLYVTQAGGGSGFIAATEAQLAEYPDCVKYAQLPTSDPYWADVYDFEAGAGGISDLALWARGAQESYSAGTRPGQRMAAVYCSASNVHVVANALTDGGVKSGVGLMLANWNLTEAQAAADVAGRSGPFPVIGVQYQDSGAYDLDLWATAWLNTRSAAPAPSGYGAPKNLKAIGGHDSVRLTWQPPGTPGLPDPADYEVYIYTSAACTRSSLVPSWAPRSAGAALTIEGGSLARGRTYYARVIAAGPDGKDVRPLTYASATFATG